MFCNECGAELADNSKFCTQCGNIIHSKSNFQNVHLRCKNCNGVMSYDDEKAIMICPYCGSKELLIENDMVAVERIKNRTYKEIKFREMDMEVEREQIRAKEQKLTEFKRSGLGRVAIVFSIICSVVALFSFGGGKIVAGFVALVQAILFIISLLIGKQIIKTQIENLNVILTIVGLLMIITFFLVLRLKV